MSKEQVIVVIRLLGADSSVPAIRHTMCIVLCFVAPVLIGIGVWSQLPTHSSLVLCQILAPLFGLGGSILWLLWPWFRTDIQTSQRFIVLPNSEHNIEKDESAEQPAEPLDAPVTTILDRAEKVSYGYVGLALALSWALTLVPVIKTEFDASEQVQDLESLSKRLDSLSSTVHRHSQLLEYPSNLEPHPPGGPNSVPRPQ